ADPPALAPFVPERPADARPELVGRALRVGLLAIQDTAVTLNVDVVRAEFEKLMRQAESANDKAAQALEQTLRANFADGDGRLPRSPGGVLGRGGVGDWAGRSSAGWRRSPRAAWSSPPPPASTRRSTSSARR